MDKVVKPDDPGNSPGLCEYRYPIDGSTGYPTVSEINFGV